MNTIHYNDKKARISIENTLIPSIKDDNDILIVTGYSSIDYLAHYIDGNLSKDKKIRVLIGNEFPDEIRAGEDAKNYWNKRGFQSKSFLKIARLLEALTAPEYSIDVKILDGLHAKTIVTESKVTNGSANFSFSGMRHQYENVTWDNNNSDRYTELKEKSEDYWSLARDYKDDLVNLIQSIIYIEDDYLAILKIINDELVNGEWFTGFKDKTLQEAYSKLWAWQKSTVSQALYILDNNGAVVIAEPTGSGKTKVGAFIAKHLTDKLSREDSSGSNSVVIIAPPKVEDEWRNELSKVNVACKFISLGKVKSTKRKEDGSNALSVEKENIIKNEIKTASIILIDEAHLFKNIGAERSKVLLTHNQALYTVMLSATPINKGLNDMYGFICQVGADSLKGRTLKHLKRTLESHKQSGTMNAKEIQQFSDEISNFTVRKTKDEINKIAIKNNMKTYPNSHVREYEINIPADDAKILNQIKNEAAKLRGIAYFPNSKTGFTQKGKASQPTTSGGLARHFLYRAIRSSKAAAIKYVLGTGDQSEYLFYFNFLGLPANKDGRLNKLLFLKDTVPCYTKPARGNICPENYWIFNKEEFQIELGYEIEIYKRIATLLKRLSDFVIEQKINHILSLQGSDKHIVFDSSTTTVKALDYLTKKRKTDYEVISYTGSDNNTALYIAKNKMGIDKTDDGKKVILFASLALSESVNLQASNSVIYSDVPYTPGDAEQREGRVSRINSKYYDLDIHWVKPIEGLELGTDKKIAERYLTVQQTLGANINIPSFFIELAKKKVEDVDMDQISQYVKDDISFSEDVSIEESLSTRSKDDSMSLAKAFFESYNIDRLSQNTGKNQKETISFVECDTDWSLIFMSNDGYGVPSLKLIVKDEVIDEPKKLFKNLAKLLDKSTNLNLILEHKDLDDVVSNRIDLIKAQAKDKVIQKLTNKEQSALNMLYSYLDYMIFTSGDDEKQSFATVRADVEAYPNKRDLARRWLKHIRPKESSALTKIDTRNFEMITYNEQVLASMTTKATVPESSSSIYIALFNRDPWEREDMQVRAMITTIKR